jgi:hypothetical protein
MCSFAGFVQANFLQAAADYKKKIGFNGNYNVATWFIRSHFSVFDIVQYFNYTNLMINIYLAFTPFYLQEHCWLSLNHKNLQNTSEFAAQK